MLKRTFIVTIGFVCILIVVIIGNLIILSTSDYKNNNLIEIYNAENDLKNRNLSILIEIDSKLLYVIDSDTDEVVKKYVVATGTKDTPTPIGSFKIVQKGMWGEGFGTRWMGLNVPWGKYGIHGTNKPGSIGYNSSHGCIRMLNKDIEELYSIVKYSTKVVIVGGPYGPFSHGFRILKHGDRGADVQEVQKRLKHRGYYSGSIDGVYGDGMKAAITKFYKDNKMPITDRIGHDTYKKLDIILMD